MRGKLIFSAILAVFGAQMTVAQSQSGCALPDGLSSLIASKFPNTHVVSLSDLNQDDKMLFQKEHGSGCPGLTRVDYVVAVFMLSQPSKRRGFVGFRAISTQHK